VPQRPLKKPVDPEMEALDRQYGLQPPAGPDPEMAELDQMYGQAPPVPNPLGRPAPVEEPSQLAGFGSEFWRRLNDPVLPEVHREEGTWDPDSLASKADFFAKEMGKNTYEMARGLTTPLNVLLGLATGGAASASRTLGPAARGIGKAIAAGFSGYEGAQAAKSLGEFAADPSLEKAAPLAQHTGFSLLAGVGAHAVGKGRPGGAGWDQTRIKEVQGLLAHPQVDSASIRGMKRVISQDLTLPPELRKYLESQLDQADFGLQTGRKPPPDGPDGGGPGQMTLGPPNRPPDDPGGGGPGAKIILRPPEAGKPTPTMGPFPGPQDILTGERRATPREPMQPGFLERMDERRMVQEAEPPHVPTQEELMTTDQRALEGQEMGLDRLGRLPVEKEAQGMPKEALSPEPPASIPPEPIIPGMPRQAEPAPLQKPLGMDNPELSELFGIEFDKPDAGSPAAPDPWGFAKLNAELEAARKPPAGPDISGEVSMLSNQRKRLFGVADRKKLTKQDLQDIAGKRVSSLTVAEANALTDRVLRISPEEIAGIRQKRELPLIDKAEAPSGPRETPPQPTSALELFGIKPEPKPKVIVKGPRKAATFDPQKSIVDAIIHLGGIRSDTVTKARKHTKKGRPIRTMDEEWAVLPQGVKSAIFRKKASASGPDDMVEQLRGMGWQITDENHLLQLLGQKDVRKKGLGGPSEKEMAASQAQWLDEQMESGARPEPTPEPDIEFNFGANALTPEAPKAEIPEVFQPTELFGAEGERTLSGLLQKPEPPKQLEPGQAPGVTEADRAAARKAYREREKTPPVSAAADEFSNLEAERRKVTEQEYRNQILTNPDTGNRRVALGLEKQKAKPEVRGPLFGKEAKPKTEKKAQKNIFGPEDGFLDLRGNSDLLRSDDPATQKIFDRLNEKKKAAKDKTPPERAIPNPGEPDVPRGLSSVGAAIRPLDLVLERIPATRGITNEIKYKAHWEGTKAVEQWLKKANKILRSSKIKPDTPEDYALTSLLDSATTNFTPEKLRAQAAAGAFPGNAENVMRAYNEFRNKWFDPTQRALNDPRVLESVGKTGYISGYFPHIHSREFARFGKETAIAMMRDFLPEEMRPGRFKPREKNAPGYEQSIFKVITPYLSAWKRMKYDIPAYDRSIKIVEGLPEGSIRRAAKWYADNYIGQPSSKNIATANESYMKASKFVSDRVYDSAIGLNLSTWALNLTQASTHTWPKLGKHARGGLADLMTAEGRDKFHRSGLLMDFAMLEGTKPKGRVRRVLHAGMEGTEYLNRGVAYLGGLRQAKEIGLVGAAAQKHAYSVVGETNFFYSKVSPVWALEQAGPMGKTFATFPLKTADMAIEIFKGARKDPARLTRFLMVTAGAAGLLKASGMDAKDVERWSLGLSDVVPGLAPLPRDILVDLPKFLYEVGIGKKEYSDIPEKFLKYLDRRFTPARKLTHAVVETVAQ
jgi:hypothetical protein